ncbi:MAG: hypothetical protein GXP46_09860 [Deferribacteres bacterium]|nr:hypothetical protein [Deferribacteres bacterium]
MVYIGGNYTDVNGNPNAIMFRITTDPQNPGKDPSQWTLSPLGNINRIAGGKDDAKRITSAPSAAMDDMANLWVYFGTGQFFGASDKNRTDTGAFYAIKDKCWDGRSCISSSSAPALIDISTSEVALDGTVTGVKGCSDTIKSWTDLINASNTCDGWVLYYKRRGEREDFTGERLARYGERSLSKPLVFGGLVSWGTYIPGKNECAPDKGENHAYSVYYKTGTAFKYYVFDEQKKQAEEESLNNASGLVARIKKLKIVHPPAPPTAQITAKGTVKIFFPGGEAAISGIESNTPLSMKSGIAGCKNEEIP